MQVCAVVLVADVLTPGRAVAVGIDLHKRQVRQKSRRAGAMPVILVRFEEDAIAGMDLLNRGAASSDSTDALRHVDRLTVGMPVQRGPCAGREMHAARIDARPDSRSADGTARPGRTRTW